MPIEISDNDESGDGEEEYALVEGEDFEEHEG